LKQFPAILGKETSGTTVALPTDSAILNNATYKKNGFNVGMKVTAVLLTPENIKIRTFLIFM
jgi:NADPH2:quinone reductase